MINWNKEFQRVQIGYHDIDGEHPKFTNCFYLETDKSELKEFCEHFVLTQCEFKFDRMYLCQDDDTLKQFDAPIEQIKKESLFYLWQLISQQAEYYLKLSAEFQCGLWTHNKEVCREGTPTTTKCADIHRHRQSLSPIVNGITNVPVISSHSTFGNSPVIWSFVQKQNLEN